MSHLVLLGDSIIDNGVYVQPQPDVTSQLRARLGQAWKVTRLAVDGHVTADVRRRQLDKAPVGTTHFVVSAGGNDALGHSSVLTERVGSVAEAVCRLAEVQAAFAAAYADMLDAVLRLSIPTAVCTIYDANYPEPQRRLVTTALALFNDVISRAAFARSLPLIDLRLICSEPADYANPIEPSSTGGEKIARVIAQAVGSDSSERPSSTVWT